MSEQNNNVGKWIVEISRYGSAWSRGIVKSETAKSYLTEDGRRVMKGASVILSPDAGGYDRAVAASVASRPEINRLTDLLNDAVERRRLSQIAAIEGRSNA